MSPGRRDMRPQTRASRAWPLSDGRGYTSPALGTRRQPRHGCLDPAPGVRISGTEGAKPSSSTPSEDAIARRELNPTTAHGCPDIFGPWAAWSLGTRLRETGPIAFAGHGAGSRRLGYWVDIVTAGQDQQRRLSTHRPNARLGEIQTTGGEVGPG